MKLENLNEQQRMKLRDCKTNEELLSVLQSEKIELDAEDLDCVSGGSSVYCGFAEEEALALLKFLKQQDQPIEPLMPSKSEYYDLWLTVNQPLMPPEWLTDEPLMPSDPKVTGLPEPLKP